MGRGVYGLTMPVTCAAEIKKIITEVFTAHQVQRAVRHSRETDAFNSVIEQLKTDSYRNRNLTNYRGYTELFRKRNAIPENKANKSLKTKLGGMFRGRAMG